MPDLDLASHRRAIPPIPRWTKHEPEGRADTSNKPRVTGGPKAWCYLCNAEHPIEECMKERPHRRRCAYCRRVA